MLKKLFNNGVKKMNKYIMKTLITITLFFPLAANADWTFLKLDSLGDKFDDTIAYSINDSGQVVGKSADHAFLTGSNGGGMIDLHPYSGPGSSSSSATGINNSGQVTGVWQFFEGRFPGDHKQDTVFITGPNGVGFTDLGAFGALASRPGGINDSGQIAGIFVNSDVNAFLTGSNGAGMTEINIPTSVATSLGIIGINNSGQVIGNRQYDGELHAFITGSNGISFTDLPELQNVTNSHALGINNFGQVIGYSTIPSGTWGFVTGPDGADITNLGGTIPFGINDSGEIVGRLGDGGFIYSHGGITDLSLLAPVIASNLTSITPFDINNNGQIVGYGIDELGQQVGFLLSYTPDTVFNPQTIHIPAIP